MRLVGGFDAVWRAFDCHVPIVVSHFRHKSDLDHTYFDFVNYGEFND